MEIYLNIFLFQLCLELIGAVLTGIVCDDNAADIQTLLQKFFSQPQHIHIIGDAQITPDFIFFNIGSTDDNHDFCIIGKLHQHFQLGVRRKARKNTGSVVIVKKLAAKFQIKLVPELADSFLNMF